MITRRIPSAIPYYLTGGAGLLYAGLFPLYRWYHFLIMALILTGLFYGSRMLFPGTEMQIEEPVDTGDKELDALIVSGLEQVGAIKTLGEKSGSAQISGRIDELEQISIQIFEIMKKEPGKVSEARTFLNYYLPTTHKLLESYQLMSSQGIAGDNISRTMESIENVMEAVVQAFRKELDRLFEGRAMDIAIEIRTLNTIMNEHGLQINNKGQEGMKI